MLAIDEETAIDESELQFEFSRSSGPGGQNVNKVETKVRLRFDLLASGSLGEDQKQRLLDRLGRRLTREGQLQIVCQRHRSREANRQECIARFVAVLAEALEETPERRPTRVSRAQKARRLENKRRRSEKKAARRRVEPD